MNKKETKKNKENKEIKKIRKEKRNLKTLKQNPISVEEKHLKSNQIKKHL